MDFVLKLCILILLAVSVTSEAANNETLPAMPEATDSYNDVMEGTTMGAETPAMTEDPGAGSIGGPVVNAALLLLSVAVTKLSQL